MHIVMVNDKLGQLAVGFKQVDELANVGNATLGNPLKNPLYGICKA